MYLSFEKRSSRMATQYWTAYLKSGTRIRFRDINEAYNLGTNNYPLALTVKMMRVCSANRIPYNIYPDLRKATDPLGGDCSNSAQVWIWKTRRYPSSQWPNFLFIVTDMSVVPPTIMFAGFADNTSRMFMRPDVLRASRTDRTKFASGVFIPSLEKGITNNALDEIEIHTG